MARNFTLGALVTRCRERSDMEAGGLIDDTEFKGYISTVYAELHELLSQSGLRFFESIQTITSVTDNGDGGGYIALPADYLGTIGVDYQYSTNERRELREIMAQERNLYGGSNAGEAYAYAIVGANLILYPKPASSQTYKHHYNPMPTDLSASADATVVDVVVPAGEDFVIWGVVRMALAKEESDTSMAERSFERARMRIEEAAQLRAITSPRRRIVDDEQMLYDPADFYPWRR